MLRLIPFLIFALPGLSQTITTVGGNSSWGRVTQVAADKSGNLYAADYDVHVVYKIDRFGATTIVAGTSARPGGTGDGGPAASALLRNPCGVAVGADNSIYIADYGNDRIRKVSPSGVIATVAGSGTGGFLGDGGSALTARINGPFTLALDANENIYFVDYGNYRVRRVTTSGTITTVAGSGRPAVSGDGGLATAADLYPGWIAFGPDGLLYISDDLNGPSGGTRRIRRVSASGTISTVAGNGTSGFSGDGGLATAAQLSSAEGIAIDSGGNLYIAEYLGHRIRKVAQNGIITTYAGTGRAGSTGDGGPAVSAQISGPTGLLIDREGNLLLVDSLNEKIRKITQPPIPTIGTTSAAIPSFIGKTNFASNTYVEIYGQSLASNTRTWAGADFNGANAPTSLDGTSVTVNGKPAYIYFISPGQININTPEDTATGAVQIQVKTANGISNIGTAIRARLSPALQSIPQFNIGGVQYVVALTPDFQSFIGAPGLLAGISFVAAKPGDIVSIYALGCGPTDPPTQAGVVAAVGSPLALPYQVRIAGIPAQVNFAGIVAGSIGLYQFNVVIPNVTPGNHPIELTVDGVANAQNLSITIGR